MDKILYRYCSEVEATLRQHQGDVHYFEATDDTKDGPVQLRKIDPYKCVHRYYRSSSENLPIVSQGALLTFEQLMDTVNYLINDIWKTSIKTVHATLIEMHVTRHPSSSSLSLLGQAYSFVMDRLAAVRQTLTMKTAIMLSEEAFRDTPTSFESLGTDPAVVDVLLAILRFYIHSDFVVSCHQGLASLSFGASSDNQFIWYDRSLHSKAILSALAALVAVLSIDSIRRINGIDLVIEEVYVYYLLFTQLELVRIAFDRSLKLSDVLRTVGQSPSTFPNDLRMFVGNDSNRPWLSVSWDVIADVRRGNPAVVFRFLKQLCSSRYNREEPLFKGVASLLFLYLPYARLWRLLLANKVANKSEGIPDALMQRRLFLDIDNSESTVSLFCASLGLRHARASSEVGAANSAVQVDMVYLNDPTADPEPSFQSLLKVIDAFGSAQCVWANVDDGESTLKSLATTLLTDFYR